MDYLCALLKKGCFFVFLRDNYAYDNQTLCIKSCINTVKVKKSNRNRKLLKFL